MVRFVAAPISAVVADVSTKPPPALPPARISAPLASVRVLARSLPPRADDLPAGVVPDDLVWEETIAAGGYASRRLARGTRLRSRQIDGEQMKRYGYGGKYGRYGAYSGYGAKYYQS